MAASTGPQEASGDQAPPPAPPPPARAGHRACSTACLAGGLAILVTLIGHWRHHPMPDAPGKRDPRTAEAWMADSLPGVGSRTRDQAARALRDGRTGSLPKAARHAAAACFDLPEGP